MPTTPSSLPDASPHAGDGRFDAWCAERLVVQATVARRTRAGGAPDGFDAAAYAQADLLEVQFADGSVFYTDPQEFAERHPAEGTTRGLAEGGKVRLPFDLASADAGAQPATRGGDADSAAQVECYRIARLTEPTTLDKLYDFGALFAKGLDSWFGNNSAPGAGILAAKLCRAFENAQAHPALGDGNGVLLRWNGRGWEPLAEGALSGEPREVLLLLHGTASSTAGSFHGLWLADAKNKASPIAEDWKALADDPKRTVLAFEHRSLTVSPFANLVDLLHQLKGLPAGSRLRMLSHSRGGLVGELLSLALGSKAEIVARVQALEALFVGTYADENHPDLDFVRQVFSLLGSEKFDPQWQPAGFVRVACPARGTLLADKRTDFFLSMLLRSLGLALGGAGNGNPFFERLQGLVRALVAARADARRLPGLEAMIPGAPLSVVLNSAPLPAAGGPSLAGKLRVVAGDSQGLGFAGLLTLMGDVFYGGHDHDFVVHTHAMFGGFARADARSLRVEDKSVTHFGYFNPGSLTRGTVMAALRGEDNGWQPMADDEARTRGWWQAIVHEYSGWTRQQWLDAITPPGGGARPILVVLPGIMGSELRLAGGGAGVWLSPPSMLDGKLAALNLADARRLEAGGMMPVAYEQLLERARARFDVVTLPYDWRLPVPQAAAQLLELLKTLAPIAEARNVPVHLLAHSMGGLVARLALWYDEPTLAAQRGDVVTRLTGRGLRLVQAGTPNRGSYAPVQLLMQQHSLSRTVAAMARKVTAADLAAWGAAFPGLMTMLPDAADPLFGDLFTAAAWQRAKQADATITCPDPAVLVEAAKVRKWLKDSFEDLKKNRQVFYVAGQGLTPLGFRLLGGSGLRPGVLRLGVSLQGDGTVPWDSTLAPERTWYTDCAHGDLLDHTDAFDGYFDLLLQGRTSRLSQQRPATRGDDALAGQVLEVPALPSLPADPAAFVLGVSKRSGRRAALPPIGLAVVHGSLDYARYPLLVGHYLDDGIFGAVQRVDEKLDGQFSRMVKLKLFVGAELTSVYLRAAPADGSAPAYPGAIVLGLGQLGALTPSALADTVTRGILRHAVEHLNQDRWSRGDGPLLLRLSTLLVGTHVQAVSVRDSLASVLQGVWRAGQILATDAAMRRTVRIAELEVIEFDETVALDAAYELRSLLDRPEWKSRFAWPQGTLDERDGGIRGYRPRRNDSVWQRLSVRADPIGGLKFELLAERARVESTQTHADVASLEKYIASVCDAAAASAGRGGDAGDQAQFGRILFRLLLPQALKTRLANYEQTVLVVEDKAAQLPWELMTPPLREGAGAESGQPLAIQAGMVRQRLTTEFRTQLPQSTGDWGVLVVGAPLTTGWTREDGRELNFPALDGAVAEAAAVRKAFGDDARPWQVERFPDDADFQTVYTTLLQRPWRVLHLAGHGMVELWQRNVVDGELTRAVKGTGMVLSDQQMLTAGYVEQMDIVPEFVFINCCYSGSDAKGGGGIAGGRNLPVLASSLALQFIRMGSKAVVAAGWQVNDGDGRQFAESLYGALLAGKAFGEAVQIARREVYRGGAPRSNTWGAYQCYGDPCWRLVDDAVPGAAGDDGDAMVRRLRAAAACMSQQELADRIEQVVAIAGDSPAAKLEGALDDLVLLLRKDASRKRWLRSTRVRAALGMAYRELGQHAKALTWLLRGMGTAYSKVQMRHIELAVNSMSRLKTPAGHAATLAVLSALDALEEAMVAQPLGLEPEPEDEVAVSAASERMCLRGGDQLRLAFQTDVPADRARHMFAGAGFYARGYEGKVKQNDMADRRAYALSNAMTTAGMAALVDRDLVGSVRTLMRPEQPEGDAAAPAALDWTKHADKLLDEIDGAGPAATFWHYTNALDLRLGRQVLNLALGEPVSGDELDEIDRLVQCALVRWPAPVEVDSLGARFAQLADVLAQARARSRRADDMKRMRAAVETLRQRLKDYSLLER